MPQAPATQGDERLDVQSGTIADRRATVENDTLQLRRPAALGLTQAVGQHVHHRFREGHGPGGQIEDVLGADAAGDQEICGMMFAQAVAGRPRGEQLIYAAKAILAVFVVLAIAALLGTR